MLVTKVGRVLVDRIDCIAYKSQRKVVGLVCHAKWCEDTSTLPTLAGHLLHVYDPSSGR